MKIRIPGRHRNKNNKKNVRSKPTRRAEVKRMGYARSYDFIAGRWTLEEFQRFGYKEAGNE